MLYPAELDKAAIYHKQYLLKAKAFRDIVYDRSATLGESIFFIQSLC